MTGNNHSAPYWPEILKSIDLLAVKGRGEEVILNDSLYTKASNILEKNSDVDNQYFTKMLGDVMNDLDKFKGMSKNELLTHFK